MDRRTDGRTDVGHGRSVVGLEAMQRDTNRVLAESDRDSQRDPVELGTCKDKRDLLDSC